MTDILIHRSSPDPGRNAFSTALGGPLHRAAIASETRRALYELPDSLLKDIGVPRSEIPYVAGVLVTDGEDQASEARPRSTAATDGAIGRLLSRAALVVFAVISVLVLVSGAVLADDAKIARGKYLVTLGGCNDCHTPGYFFGKPNAARFLGGSEVGFEIPGLGVFHGPNLTPDPDTGLGTWSEDDIGRAITTGRRPDGRILAPIMPWHAFANLTGEDVRAITAFLKSLPPVKNKVPGPFGPTEQPTSFVMKILPPQVGTVGSAVSGGAVTR